MKKYLSAVMGLFISTVTLAQSAVSETKSFRADPVNHASFPVVITSLLGAVVIILIIAVLYNLATVTRLLKAELSQASSKKKTFTKETIEKTTGFQTRKWQLYIGVGILILFTTVAISWKIMAGSQSQSTTSLAIAESDSPPNPFAADATPSDVSSESTTIEKGKQLFQSNCASCHRNDGGGTIGPNLTDEFWLHGGESEKIYSTIQSGVASNGMPAWANILTSDNIKDVTAYVVSLQGTNPPDAKAPQGEKIVRTSAPK
jgi:mono/diheme cytochrome c family protein